MKKALFISGGGTKIPFLGAVASTIIKDFNYHFDVIVGVSAGAILSLPLAMSLHDEIKDFVINQKDKDIFKRSPNSLKGKIFAFLNIISGRTYLFNDSNLEKTIKSVITKERFNLYKYDRKKPTCYVVAVDVETGEEILINLRNESYEDAIQYVLASSSIPVYVGPRKVKGRYLYDGGMRSHIGSHTYLKRHYKEIKSCVSVYSRADDLKSYKWQYPKPKLMAFNIIKVLARTIEIMNIEISKSDEYKMKYICEDNNIRNIDIFAPFKLSSNPYENSEELNLEMWEQGVKEANKKAIEWKQ